MTFDLLEFFAFIVLANYAGAWARRFDERHGNLRMLLVICVVGLVACLMGHAAA